MSTITWILFALAGAFYLLAWSPMATGLAVLGIVFELLMYMSMYVDKEEKSDKKLYESPLPSEVSEQRVSSDPK